MKRAAEAGLVTDGGRRVHRPNFEELLLHGLRFIAPAKLGPLVTGVPAAWAAPPMNSRIRETGAPPPVWPFAAGTVRGQELPPLHRAAARAVSSWLALGELLAIVDSLRAGDVRVRSVAAELLPTALPL